MQPTYWGDTPSQRKRHSEEFRQQAVLRAAKDGVPAVARDLGLDPAQLYAWRAKAVLQGQDAEVQRLQQSEAARLKRELAWLEEEVAAEHIGRTADQLFFPLAIWLACTSKRLASSASVASPWNAASATLALNAGEWFPRGCLLIFCSCFMGHIITPQSRDSTYRAVQISGANSFRALKWLGFSGV